MKVKARLGTRSGTFSGLRADWAAPRTSNQEEAKRSHSSGDLGATQRPGKSGAQKPAMQPEQQPEATAAFFSHLASDLFGPYPTHILDSQMKEEEGQFRSG